MHIPAMRYASSQLEVCSRIVARDEPYRNSEYLSLGFSHEGISGEKTPDFGICKMEMVRWIKKGVGIRLRLV